jgi:pilus assembly protein CpaC
MAPVVVLWGADSAQPPLQPADSVQPAQEFAPAVAASPTRPGVDRKLQATVGKSLIIDSPLRIDKISVANGELVEAVPINPQEVLINGKAPGETSIIVWQHGGQRLVYDLTVRMNPVKLDAVRDQVRRDFPNDNINISLDNDTVFVRGTVKDLLSANRVMGIASTLAGQGKTLNLLRVAVAPAAPEILLKVKFATIDIAAERDLGFSLLTSAFGQQTNITPSQTGISPNVSVTSGSPISSTTSLSGVAQILLFRKDLNLGAAIQAYEKKNLAEILAEPNLLTADGQEASFVSGGSFPIPVVQSGAASGAVTIMYEEYGVKLKFLPVITPHNTIRMRIAPEYSVIDNTTSVTIDGFTIPGLKTQKTESTVELESGQSFVIAGLMDRTTSNDLAKIPGLSSIPLLGELSWKEPFMKPISPTVFQPGMDKTGPPADLNVPPVAYEEMMEQLTKETATSPKSSGTPLLAAPLQPMNSTTTQTAAPAASPAPAKQ